MSKHYPPQGSSKRNEILTQRHRSFQDLARTRVVNRFVAVALIAFTGFTASRLAYALIFESRPETAMEGSSK